MPVKTFLLLASLLTAAPAFGQTHAPFVIQESGQGFAHLADAVQSVKDGAATILIAPGTYQECAIQQSGDITFRAVTPGTAIFEHTICEGKAVLVLRGHSATVDGIVFRKLDRIGDGNSAGIRIEKGNLNVTNTTFLDSQEGILGGGDDVHRVAIDHSTFAGLGQCDESSSCAHSIYLTLPQGVLHITHTRFERGTGGHYVKLRGPQVAILDSSFDDSQGHKTNYTIELPEGGTGLISHNVLLQGPNKENGSAIIMVAAEARKYDSTNLTIEDNVATLAPGADNHRPAFLVDFTHQPIQLIGNRIGPGITPFETRDATTIAEVKQSWFMSKMYKLWGIAREKLSYLIDLVL